MHVTNVHGSAEGQDMLKLVESIENEKKEKEKKLFYRCKAKQVCSGIRATKSHKESTVGLEIKKSACSKASCHRLQQSQ